MNSVIPFSHEQTKSVLYIRILYSPRLYIIVINEDDCVNIKGGVIVQGKKYDKGKVTFIIG